jgi:hypothetical protein
MNVLATSFPIHGPGWQTLSSMISFLEVSSSFFVGSSASFAASPSFLASASDEYHRDAMAGRSDDGVKESCDGRNWGRATDARE